MSSPDVIPDQTVICDSTGVAVIASRAEVEVAGADVIDGTGRYLMPGLADMHVHWHDLSQVGMYLANGVTTVRNMWGHPWHLAMARAVDEGSVPGPRVITTSPGFDGVLPGGGTIWPGSIAATSPVHVEAAVDGAVSRGYRQIKAYELLDVDTLREIGRAAAGRGVDVVGHCPESMSMETAIDAGMTCFEHLQNLHVGRLLPGDPLPPRGGDRVKRIGEMARRLDLESVAELGTLMRDREVWSCPTLTLWDGYGHAATEDPLLRFEPPATARVWSLEGRGLTGVDPGAYFDAMAAYRSVLGQAVSVLHKTRAPLLLGTDHGNPWVFPGFAVHDEIANLLDAGLSPYEVLRLATVEAARFLGESGKWGEVTLGARADLLLIDSNPLVSPSTIRSPRCVLVNGWLLEREHLERLLEHRASVFTEPSAPLPPGDAVLDRTFGGAPHGCCSYRYHRDGDADVIDEVERDDLTSTLTTARLARDGSIDVLRTERSVPPFHATTTVHRTPEGYTVRREDLDGSEDEWALASERLFPSIVAAAPFLPDGDVELLVADDLTVTSVPAQVSRSDEGTTVAIDDPSHGGVRQYRYDDEGRIRSASDLYAGWRREWTQRHRS